MDENRNLDDYSVSEAKGRGVPTGLILLLIGVGIGSLLAATLTPRTGKQLRKGLRRRYEDARDRLEEWSDQAEGWMHAAASLRAPPAARSHPSHASLSERLAKAIPAFSPLLPNKAGN